MAEAETQFRIADPHVQFSERPRLPDVPEGRFGRLFPDLPRHTVSGDALLRYGAADGPLKCRSVVREGTDEDNPRIPAGWPIFGQYIAHDITHDRAPLQEKEKLSAVQNFRRPKLDLECLYGAGPVGQPYLYDVQDPDKFLIGRSAALVGDLPRNEQGLALVGDSRNDTHLFISQFHLAFLHFHNRVVDRLRRGQSGSPVFDRAAELVRRHYQWIVLHEFLPLTVGEELVNDILNSGPKFCRFEGRPFIPVEFSDGAYRFGHAQICSRYDLNDQVRDVPLFPDLVGICPVTSERQVDWRRMFRFPSGPEPQASRRIGPLLVPALMNLPERLIGQVARPEFGSLASRDLYRGHAVELPCGEAIARAMGLEPCTGKELKSVDPALAAGTPLWLYVLAESEVQHQGEFLGETGGRIVAEVIIELLRHDPESILNQAGWAPELASSSGVFGIADLLKIAQVA